MKPRAGQQEFERGVRRHRIAAMVTRRQYGKTTIAARIAIRKMMKTAGHTVVFGSVKLDLGREIVRKEAEQIQRTLALLAQDVKGSANLLKVADSSSGKDLTDLSADDFAELYESTRLEFRLYHSNTTYSRTKVVALTAAAVGETGDLILDEVGRVKDFRNVWEAVKPIISSNPEFRCLLTTTPPPDDTHYSFELLAPPIGFDPAADPAGNWYRSDLGVHVLRITARDAAADGIPLYDDDTGKAITPDEARRQDPDKDAWDRNYDCKFVMGGAAALGLLVLDSAQRRGVGRCACVCVQEEIDFLRGLAFLTAQLGEGLAGLGLDVATTEKGTSNPSSITVLERRGMEFVAVVTIVWKTQDPHLAKFRIRSVVETVNARPAGGRARRMAVDASNETYFATELQTELAHLVPVELVKGGETVELPGQGPITKKALLGNQLVQAFDDNRMTVAPERYLKQDLRLVMRDRGSFTTETGPNGEHGDTFDSHKLALHALTSTSGGIESVEGMHVGRQEFRPMHYTPRRW